MMQRSTFRGLGAAVNLLVGSFGSSWLLLPLIESVAYSRLAALAEAATKVLGRDIVEISVALDKHN